MGHDDELIAAAEALPIFPLPGAVLLPGQVLPLHVFEPRYRALVRHALETAPVFAIATLKPGADPLAARAEVWPELGVGRITACQELPDGRSNLLLRGVARARLDQELDTPHPFRVVRAALGVDDTTGLRAEASRLKALLAQLGANPDGDDAELVDLVVRQVVREPDARRVFLAEDRVARRAQRVAALLASRLVDGMGPVGEA